MHAGIIYLTNRIPTDAADSIIHQSISRNRERKMHCYYYMMLYRFDPEIVAYPDPSPHLT
jgi:hypothetical protein